LIRFEKAAQRTGRILTQPTAQLVRHGPGRLIRHPQFALQKFGRDAALVPTHQVGGKKPLREIRPRPMKHRSRGHRLLPMAGVALIDPRSSLQSPSRMRSREAIKAATVNAAKLLDLSDEVGTIASGKSVDVIAADSSPIDDVSVLHSMAFVMARGDVYLGSLREGLVARDRWFESISLQRRVA